MLEALVMKNILRMSPPAGVRPLGLSRVRVKPDGTTVIHLDELVDGMHADELMLRWCEQILPVSGSLGLYGAMGLRVLRASGGVLTVRLTGENAVMTLIGNGSWRDVIDQHRRNVESVGCAPLWDRTRYGKYERSEGRWLEPTAWLLSGLFRRSGIFHGLGAHFVVDGWPSGYSWVLELTTDLTSGEIETAKRQHEFLDVLLDRHLGLPLQIAHEYCVCWRPIGWGTDCRYELKPVDGSLTGELQIRFRWVSDKPLPLDKLLEHSVRRRRQRPALLPGRSQSPPQQ